MCLDLIVWFVRTLHLFAAYEKLGPKLTMIFDTVILFLSSIIKLMLMGNISFLDERSAFLRLFYHYFSYGILYCFMVLTDDK